MDLRISFPRFADRSGVPVAIRRDADTCAETHQSRERDREMTIPRSFARRSICFF